MVKKKQHRFVIGLKGANIQEILKATGSAIFVPPPEDPSENITIVGTDADMVKALQMVMEKANSVTFDEIPIGNPLYQRFLGSRGYLKLQEFQKDTKLQISFYNNAIEIQSPVKEEVTKARQLVNEYLKALVTKNRKKTKQKKKGSVFSYFIYWFRNPSFLRRSKSLPSCASL